MKGFLRPAGEWRKGVISGESSSPSCKPLRLPVTRVEIAGRERNFSGRIGQLGGDARFRDTWRVTDAEVIERSLAFPESFALLFDRHFRSLHRFLRARVGADLADDLAAETFTVAFRRRAAYDRTRADARP